MSTLRLSGSSSYYRAAATDHTSDFGDWLGSGLFRNLDWSERSLILSRLRREIVNNPFLAGLTEAFPVAIGHTSLRSRTKVREFNDVKDLWWYRYSRRVTADGLSMSELESMIWVEMLVAGEIFLLLLNDGRVQVVPSEWCGNGYGAVTSTEKGWFNGILYADNGLPKKYRFRKAAYQEAQYLVPGETIEVDAQNVIHIYDRKHMKRGRGLPWLIASLRTAHDLMEIYNANLKGIKDLSKISGVIIKAGAGSNIPFSGMTVPEDVTEPVSGSAPADSRLSSTGQPSVIDLKDGTFVGLEPGESIEQIKTDYKAGDLQQLIMGMLHAVSSPLGLPVELWFSGLGDVNFSGFKGIGVQWQRRRQDYCRWLELAGLNRLAFWRTRKAVNLGEIPANPDNDDDAIDWRWGKCTVLDEDRAATANTKRLTSGEITVADLWEENGQYAEEVFAERVNLWRKLHLAQGLSEAEIPTPPQEWLLRGKLPSEVKSDKPVTEDSSATTKQGTAQPDSEAQGELANFESLKAKFDAYGVAVRAGAITPQTDDEAAFRAEAKLPAMSKAVNGAWQEDKGYRRPITLAVKGSPQPIPQPANEVD